MQTPQTFVVAKAIVTEKNKERPFTACNFKHGDSTGLNAGKKIKDGIVSKACTSAVAWQVVPQPRQDYWGLSGTTAVRT